MLEKQEHAFLIVDDQDLIIQLMRRILVKNGYRKIYTAKSGKGALSILNKSKIDFLITDLQMPNMSGVELLTKIRSDPRYHHLPVLMVTEEMSEENVTCAVEKGVDGYQQKPFTEERIMDAIEGVLRRRLNPDEMQKQIPPETKSGIIEEIIFRFKRGEINLPSPPQISIKFKEMINKGANLQEIGDLLKQDAAISFKLISVANSVYYRGVVEKKTVGQAVSRLGLNTTRQYVEAISNRALYTTTNKKFVELIEKLWEHSLSCAYASQIVSEVLKLKLECDAFTMGLLHDIGKLILLQVFGELEIKGKLGEEVSKVELLNDLDTHHGKFGVALLKRWQFSNGYLQIAMYHDNLDDADPISKDLLVVHFANLLVKSMGYDLGQQAEIDLEDAESTGVLRLESTMIDEIKDQVKGRMEEMGGIFA